MLHDPGLNPHLTVNKHALRATQGAGGTDRAAERGIEGSADTLFEKGHVKDMMWVGVFSTIYIRGFSYA